MAESTRRYALRNTQRTVIRIPKLPLPTEADGERKGAVRLEAVEYLEIGSSDPRDADTFAARPDVIVTESEKAAYEAQPWMKAKAEKPEGDAAIYDRTKAKRGYLDTGTLRFDIVAA